MSLITWKKEFYSKKPSKRMSTLEAIKHSLKKWKGLTQKNLKKHKVLKPDQEIYIVDIKTEFYNTFNITDESCSLCIKFRRKFFKYEFHECENCPLYKIDNIPCTNGKNPYLKFVDKNDPKPMIKLLEKALKNEQRRSSNK